MLEHSNITWTLWISGAQHCTLIYLWSTFDGFDLLAIWMILYHCICFLQDGCCTSTTLWFIAYNWANWFRINRIHMEILSIKVAILLTAVFPQPAMMHFFPGRKADFGNATKSTFELSVAFCASCKCQGGCLLFAMPEWCNIMGRICKKVLNVLPGAKLCHF